MKKFNKRNIINRISSLDTLLNTGKLKEYKFNLTDLPAYGLGKDIRQVPVFKPIFNELRNNRGFCIYWFQCANGQDANTLASLFQSKKEELIRNDRSSPPVNATNSNSMTLYVGVRQGGYTKKWDLSHMESRFYQHLGYYEKGRTGSLQLAHWANKSNVEVTLSVLEFKDIPHIKYLYVLEKLISIELEPKLGSY